MKKLMPLGVLLAAAFASSVFAQSTPIASNNLSGTIAFTSTFQPIQGQTNNRQGCLIQNNGTHTMLVYFGNISSAATTNSATLAPSDAINCSVPGAGVVKDAISIEGTAGDAFFANFQ